jgi:hypothetical protein
VRREKLLRWSLGLIAASAFCLTGAGKVMAIELVTNGGFEASTSALTGWTTSGLATDVASTVANIDSTMVTINPHSGNRMAQLRLTSTPATMTQTLAISGFTTGNLSFWYDVMAADLGANTPGGQLMVMDGANVVLTVPLDDPAGTGPTSTGWTHFAANGIALSGSTLTLSFASQSASSPADVVWADIDDVSFQASSGIQGPAPTIPEPVPAALGLAGLSALALAASRRRPA